MADVAVIVAAVFVFLVADTVISVAFSEDGKPTGGDSRVADLVLFRLLSDSAGKAFLLYSDGLYQTTLRA